MSFHEGSKFQERFEDVRDSGRRITSGPAAPIGKRSYAATLSESDLRAIVGAPADAIVEIGEDASKLGSAAVADVVVRVKWRDK